MSTYLGLSRLWDVGCGLRGQTRFLLSESYHKPEDSNRDIKQADVIAFKLGVVGLPTEKSYQGRSPRGGDVGDL